MGKLTAGLIGAVLVVLVGVPLTGMLLSPLGINLEPYLFLVAGILLSLTLILALSASRTAKAWRRILILSSSLSLCLSALHLLSDSSSNGEGQSSDFVGLMTFIVGVVLLLIGLLTGREQTTYKVKTTTDNSFPDSKG